METPPAPSMSARLGSEGANVKLDTARMAGLIALGALLFLAVTRKGFSSALGG